MTWLVYRSGSGREDNLTPRMIKDTVGKPGQSPGLSTYTTPELAVPPGGKAQVIDLDLLQLPLRGLEDQPLLEGGREGHVSIAPTTPDGEVDRVLLEEWAATRGTDQVHRLTEIVQQALVATVRRPR
ncbi:MAG: hypothetical protein ACLQU5_34720 [Isosphaeraceae bacterium]